MKYRTIRLLEQRKGNRLATFLYYLDFFRILFASWIQARRERFDIHACHGASWHLLHRLDQLGARFSVNGLDQLAKLDRAPICIANHMSFLDVLVLPAFLSPYWEVSFVIKHSLLRYPFFGRVLRSTLPIRVSRTRVREDFVQVMNKGSKHLESGRAIVIFQQYSRATDLVKTQFSSLGIKLAKRTGAPVLPIAL